jgi:tetratricopeptide (TPR) repeat protein
MAAFGLLVALSAGAFALRRKLPCVIVGWLWYLGMLVPVLGILHIGGIAYADRYTYLPQIGLAIAATWAVADWTAKRQYRRVALGVAASVVLGALSLAAWRQTGVWRDSETLYTHALACQEDNPAVHQLLGNTLEMKERNEDAIAQYREALRLNPAFAEAHSNLAETLAKQGQIEEAIVHYQEALRLDPASAGTHSNFGFLRLNQGQISEAIPEFHEALRLDPDSAEAHSNLGITFLQQGQLQEAAAEVREALRLRPDFAEAHSNLGLLLFLQGQSQEAIAHAAKALDLQPANPDLQNALAWMLATAPQATLRNGARALELAAQASRSGGAKDPQVLRTLAAAYAEAGKFQDAVQTAQNALQVSEFQSNTEVSNMLRREIKLYQAGHSFEDAR